MTIMHLSLIGTKLSSAQKVQLADRLIGEFATVFLEDRQQRIAEYLAKREKTGN